ncbi:MAG: TolC family protein [Bacteroidia bacterium]|nr:TolC family protein [Bacteroidia bacterium]
MRQSAIIAIALATSTAVPSLAQQEAGKKVWSLKDCVSYAIENNLDIKRMEQSCQSSDVQVDNAKSQYLPSVSAFASQGFDFGRGLTANNTYANRNTKNTSMGVSVQMTLFEYGRAAQKRAAQLDLNAALADLENAKDDIGIAVARAYLQVLYSKDMVEVNKKQLELSELQLQQRELQVNQGRAAESDVYQAKSRVASDKMSLVKAQNDYEMAILDLTQQLELPSPEDFEVEEPSVDVVKLNPTSPEQIYAEALLTRDDIKAAQYREQSAQESIEAAKGGHIPTLSLSGGVNTSAVSVSGMENSSYGDQFKDHLDKQVSVSLSIPIFSRFSTSNRVKSAKISRATYAIAIDQAKKTLYKEIQQAYYNATYAQSQFEASVSAQEAAKESLDMQTKKFSAGRITQTEYNEALNSWTKAEADMVQAKYSFAFAVKILDFYRGAEMQ